MGRSFQGEPWSEERKAEFLKDLEAATLRSRGNMYWSARQVRVHFNNGHLIDLGPKPVEQSVIVASMLSLTFHFDGTEAAPA